MLKMTRGQSLMEYIILVGIVSTALVVMSPPIRRGLQDVVRLAADQLAPQSASEQESGATDQYVVNSVSNSHSIMNRQLIHQVNDITYVFNDEITSSSDSLVNMGFTPGE
ncbi:MAG: hypothetical protein WC676_01470 [Candidatus Omnitrophota bacterium]